MFEDSTFESTGRIRTRSRGWMLAAFFFNGSILVALISIPLIYPEALPRQWMTHLIEAPHVPVVQPHKPKPEPDRAVQHLYEMQNGHLIAPPRIPRDILNLAKPEAPAAEIAIVGVPDFGQNGPGADDAIFRQHNQPAVVHQASGPVHVTSTIAEGMLLQKTLPVYPPIAKAVRRGGTVVLQAVISTRGAIENLRVVSGDPMLIQAAREAVMNWRYRPYLLNGQPVEVETTINVIFKLTQ